MAYVGTRVANTRPAGATQAITRDSPEQDRIENARARTATVPSRGMGAMLPFRPRTTLGRQLLLHELLDGYRQISEITTVVSLETPLLPQLTAGHGVDARGGINSGFAGPEGFGAGAMRSLSMDHDNQEEKQTAPTGGRNSGLSN
jgi:hypothetical protein